jgi:nucleoside-diphosphate-sugar epimerase
MKVLFIGGTGLISTAVTKLAIKKGIDLTLLNRGQRSLEFSNQVKHIICDINDEIAVSEKIKDLHFDAVVDWIAFTVEHVERDYRLFKGHTNQYVFISSASAYQKPIPKLPITEHEVALGNPFWEYSQNKEKCELYLQNLKDNSFSVTIIRPSHTYNHRSVVSQLNSWINPYTLLHRLKMNKPVIMPDQGKALWTLTYNEDFAFSFLDVLGNPKTYNDFYHLTSDKSYTWMELFEMLKKATHSHSELIYIPIEKIAKQFPDYYGSLLGDMRESALFDNSKIKKVAPNYVSITGYEDVVSDIVTWYENHLDQQMIDEDFNRRYDDLVKTYQQK